MHTLILYENLFLSYKVDGYHAILVVYNNLDVCLFDQNMKLNLLGQLNGKGINEDKLKILYIYECEVIYDYS